jgi:assimilatory nitrate reductase catalytic subunit
MSRSGKSPRLMAHLPEPFVDIHPQDALLSGVRVGELVRVVTRWGAMVARLRSSGEMPRRMIFVPMHWNSTLAADARVGALVNPVVDPVSGEPEFKHTPARVAAFVVAWQGFILSRRPVRVVDATWWSMARGVQFFRQEIAGRRVPGDWSAWARRQLGANADADWLEYSDHATGIYRAAHLIDDRLEACLFLSPRPDLPPRAWLSSLFTKASIDAADRTGLLTGVPSDASADVGAVVCSCFGVGRNTIEAAIAKFDLGTAREIGQKLRAGTNCGSCLPELKAMLKERAAV